MAKKQPAGIDLGTTFSVAACVDQTGRTALIKNSEGDVLTPSAVLFEKDDVVVGKEAKKAGVLRPARLALWVKRDMGSPVYSQPIEGVYLPPEVIQACILNKLRADIVRAVGLDAAVVITVPAFFDEPRRRATAIAGEIAGLEVLDIVNEPTAAALAFGDHLGMLGPAGTPQGKMNILVYDLGGGTFDVTLLEVRLGGFRTIATDGDVQLGGRDWDMRLVDLVSQDFVKKFREDPRENPVSLQRLLTEVEHAKHTLSGRQRATVQVDHAGNSHEVRVSRQEFEEATADLLERTRLTTQELLAAGRLEWKDVSQLLLVGGSTRMPMVAKMLKDLSGITPDYTVSPDEAVARGAALYAKYLLDSAEGGPLQPKYRVTNVNAHSLGIEGIEQETLEKVNTILIPRNTPLPAKATDTFVTKIHNQQSIAIRVLEGESGIPGESTLIGRTVIKNLPQNLPKGHPVEVTYEYATNGRLSVRASVPGTDQEVRLEIEREGSLADARIPRWRAAVCGGGGFDAFKALAEQELRPAAGSQPCQTPVSAPRRAAMALESEQAASTTDGQATQAESTAAAASQTEQTEPLGSATAGAAESRMEPGKKRFRRRPVNIVVEAVKIVLGGLLGLAIGQLILWWVFNTDPLPLAPRIDGTPLQFLAPADLRRLSNSGPMSTKAPAGSELSPTWSVELHLPWRTT